MKRFIFVCCIVVSGVIQAKVFSKFDRFSTEIYSADFKVKQMDGDLYTIVKDRDVIYTNIDQDVFLFDVYSGVDFMTTFQIKIPLPFGSIWNTESYLVNRCFTNSGAAFGQEHLSSIIFCQYLGEQTKSIEDERRACILPDGKLGVEIYKCRDFYPTYNLSMKMSENVQDVDFFVSAQYTDFRDQRRTCRLKTECYFEF